MFIVVLVGDVSYLSMFIELDIMYFLLLVFGCYYSLFGVIEFDDECVFGWVELELLYYGILLCGYCSLFISFLLIVVGFGVIVFFVLCMSCVINVLLELISQGVVQFKEGCMEICLLLMGSNELDELVFGINCMVEMLQSVQEEMQYNIDQVIEDVWQNLEIIEIQNIELDLVCKEVLEVSRIKFEFFVNMSYEICILFNGIFGFINLLQKSEFSLCQQDYFMIIQKLVESLLGIINEIFDFLKIEVGKLVLENFFFNFCDLIQDVLIMLVLVVYEK